MKKGKVIAMAIISLLALGACSNNSAKEAKAEPKEITAKSLRKNYDDITDQYVLVIQGMLDNDVAESKISGEELDKVAKVLDKKINSDNIKINKELKTDFNSLLKPIKKVVIYTQESMFDKIPDTGQDIGQSIRIIAEKYYHGKSPKSLTDLFDEYEESENNVDTNTSSGVTSKEERVYGKGEWWEVPGQWKLKVDSVTTTDDRNEFSDTNPAQVVIVTYTYENLGYEKDVQDLYITPDNVIDSAKKVADTYPASTSKDADTTPIGATCEGAQEAYGLSQPGGKVKIIFDEYDNDSEKHEAVFELDVE